jgi:hypothetical protein
MLEVDLAVRAVAVDLEQGAGPRLDGPQISVSERICLMIPAAALARKPLTVTVLAKKMLPASGSWSCE